MSLALLSCLISAALEARSFYAYRRLGTHWRREHKDDFRLLIYAFLGLVTQLLMAIFWSLSYFVATSDDAVRNGIRSAFPYVVDLMSLSGSVCLLMTRYAARSSDDLVSFLFSKTVRRKYLEFYGLGRLQKGMQSRTSVSRNSAVPPPYHQ